MNHGSTRFSVVILGCEVRYVNLKIFNSVKTVTNIAHFCTMCVRRLVRDGAEMRLSLNSFFISVIVKETLFLSLKNFEHIIFVTQERSNRLTVSSVHNLALKFFKK